MTGYRRIEPAFCRGCGAPWTPGANACPGCGEVIERAAPSHGDPHAITKLGRVLGAAALVVIARWTVLLTTPDIALSDWFWVASTGAPCGLLVLTAPWWYPGKLQGKRPTPWAWLAAATTGLGLAGLTAWLLRDEASLLWAFHATWDGMPLVMLGVAAVAIALEELLFRGWIFDGVSAVAGDVNAAIASTMAFALLYIDPLSILAGGAAALLRLRTGSVWPAIAARVLAVLAIRELAGLML